MDARAEFEGIAATVDAASLVESIGDAKDDDESAQMRVVAAMVRAAFSCPDAVRPLYDTIARVWLASGEIEEAPSDSPQAPLEASFWEGLWSAVDHGGKEPYTPATATARIAVVSSATHPDFLALAERGAKRRFGSSEALGPVPDTRPRVWTACPPDSIGHLLSQMSADGAFDPDVGKRRELRALPPTLLHLHALVDRLDGAWHAVAGYDATDSHLIAMAAFQLAQTGHLFSASALALFATLAQFIIPKSFHLLIHLIAEGWRHGRETPSLLGIDWPSQWDQPVGAVRERYGITMYTSIFSKQLFDSLPRYATKPEGV